MTKPAPLASLLLPALMLGCGDPIVDRTLSISMSVEAIAPTTVGTRGGEAVIVSGRNLQEVTAVRVGGKSADLVARDEHRLTFIAPGNRVGRQPLVLVGPGGEITSALGLIYKVARPSFTSQHRLAPALRFDRPNQPRALDDFGVGDFDGDGRPDLLTLRPGSLEWTGGADGREHQQAIAAPGSQQTRIVGAADMDGDGRDDLVTWAPPGDWQVWWSDPAGGPLQAESLGALGKVPNTPTEYLDARIGNFDPGPGAELAVMTGGLEILRLGRGAAPLRLKARPDIRYDQRDLSSRVGSARINTSAPAAADLDRDGLTDLVYIGADGLVHATRAPGFVPGEEWTGPADPNRRDNFRFTLGDVTGDGVADLVWPTSFGRGRGDGRFDPVQAAPSACKGGRASSQMMYAGPFAEGNGDRITVNTCIDSLTIDRWRDGQIAGHHEIPFPSAYRLQEARFVDLDRDGVVDLVHQESTGVVLGHGVFDTQNNDLVFTDHAPLPATGEVFAKRPEPSFFDGEPPLLTSGAFGPGRPLAQALGGTVTVLERSGAGLRTSARLDLSQQIDALAACDLNGDGRDELLATADYSASLLAIDVGTQGLGPPRPLTTGKQNQWPSDLIVGDLDADGRCDVLVTNSRLAREGQSVNTPEVPAVAHALRNTGAGLAPLDVEVSGPMPDENLWLGGVDLDGDGDLDLYDRKARVVLRNQGGGRFTSESLPLTLLGVSPTAFHVIELALERSGQTLTAWVLGGLADSGDRLFAGIATQEGSGPWSELRVTYAVQAGHFGLMIGDVDGDGLRDLVVRGGRSNATSIERQPFELLLFRQTTDHGLALPLPMAFDLNLWIPFASDIWYSGRLYDLDADGLDDLIVGPWWGKRLWIVHNDSE
jgi:hypothetical protein